MKLVVLDDHVTPYRIPLFARLSQHVASLTVLYCARRLQERRWEVPADLPYDHQFLPAIPIRLRRPPYDDPRTILVNPTLFTHLIRLKPDVVVGYSFSVPAITAFLYARTRSIGYVSWSTDTLHTERYLGIAQKFVRRLIIPRAEACIAPGPGAREKFLAYGAQPEAVHTAVQSADNAWFRQAAHLARINNLSYEGLPELGGEYILYVGFVSDRKGISQLLDAFSIVANKRPSSHLVIAGDGPRRPEMERRARTGALAGKVHFVGHVKQADLPVLYAGARMFVFPSLEDTFGVVLSEAAACGLPLISSMFAGASQVYVQDDENGWVVDPRAPEPFARRMLALLDDDELQERMGRRSQELAQSHTIETGARDFLGAVAQASRQKSPARHE